jgi:transcriptional regulator with XRE-family HTH domain
MTNKEKFLALVSKEQTDTLERNRERIRNRAMLRESQKIALKVLLKLDELGWKQTDLAREMGVSPQQITKIVSGKENLTIETQIKLQTILNVPILASFYETKMKQAESIQVTVAGDVVNYEPVVASTDINSKTGSGCLIVDYNKFTEFKKAI